jgi:prophage antirepressor-like protein
MNNLQIFNNQQFGQIRVVDVNTIPYFVGRDVAFALGYAKPENAISQHVDKEDTLKQGIPDNQGFIQTTTLINESGVYSLVFGSKLPSAKQFKRWVTSEVLPSVRKHGAYLTDQKVEEVLTDPDTLIKLATQLKAERAEKERLKEQHRLAEEQIKLSQPKVEYYNTVLQSDSLIATNVIADQLGLSAKRLNEILQQRQVIYRQNDTFVLYAKYRGLGYEGYRTHTYISNSTGKQHTKQHLYWTEKGREFIHGFLNGKQSKIV